MTPASPSPIILRAAAPVVENVKVARDTHRLRFRFPELARAIHPGQFVMLRVPGRTVPLLGRAFALYDVADDCVDVVHLVVGKMTRLMAALQPGDAVEVWGPLGNGFPDYAGVKHLVLVAGGIGQTPFLALTRQALGGCGYGGRKAQREAERVSLYYGARTKDLFAEVEAFEKAGAMVHLATDDGSAGFKGFVTQLLDERTRGEAPASMRWVGCGPEPMLHALADLAARRGVACDVSLETPMACGVGICFSCVAKVRDGEGWDYRRVCVEGPIFDAARIVW
jgi:dihydroorotate dehydrogenase electron transfer subunit